MPIPMLFALLQDPVTDAAETTEEVASDPPSQIWVFLFIGLIFYFLLIRPQGKEKKKREEMIKALGKGDKIMTSSGMYGTITHMTDETITLQVADGVRIKFSRQSIQGRVDESKADDAK